MVSYAWEHDDPDHPRPGEVARLEAFLNTIDHQSFGAHADKPADRRDLLATPEGLRRWLITHRLLDEMQSGVVVTDEDLQAAHALRDGLHAWLLARQQLDHDAGALDRGCDVLARVHLRVDLGADAATLEPVLDDVAGALGRLAADTVIAQVSGTLLRLKVCSAADCRFVYYDRSRSRTSRWCATETCGNRTKTRRYRQAARR